MPMPRTQKWTAFLLSLAAPGAGQLLAGSPTALAWFALTGVLAAVFLMPAVAGFSGAVSLLQNPLFLAVSLLSAWHARGLLETVPNWSPGENAIAQSHCHGGRGRVIQARIRLETSRSVDELWQRISDLPTFLTIDPFHERITLMRDQPAAGVDIVLHHNAFGYRFDRFGRILWWREGEGFAISDLSALNPQAGFPHIFVYRIEQTIDGNAALCVDVNGRWNSHRIPLWQGRMWIAAICRYHASLLQRAL